MIIEAIIEFLAWISGRSLRAGARRVPLTGGRIGAAVVAVVFGAFVVLGLVGLVRSDQRGPGDVLLTLGFLFIPATIALLCGWFALQGDLPEQRQHIKTTWRGGLILGGVGFAAGFIGPIVFDPGANQGPLLGILFTGPIGFVLGAMTGWFYGQFRTPDLSASEEPEGPDVA